jgi:UDP-N-acetylglucosamine acyltransferase
MAGSDVAVHPTAFVHPKAMLDSGVWVGPGCVIGENVVVHKNTRFDSHVAVVGWAEIGPDCHFFSFTSIGTEPQDVDYKGDETRVRIGARNIFREFVSVNRGTVKGGGLTQIGDDNYIMAYCHIAHDCRVGNQTTMINGATLGGHVTVEDHVMISAFSAFHQFSRVGRFAFVGGYSVITQDVLPFSKVAGQRPVHIFGLNTIGLRRKGFTKERIAALKGMFKIFFFSDLNTAQAIERIQAEYPAGEDRDEIVRFVQTTKRGIIKKAAEAWDLESE